MERGDVFSELLQHQNICLTCFIRRPCRVLADCSLQAIVLSIVIFLQFQPPEVASLAICLPFAKGGCVGIVDYFRIVFTGAPIPPL